MTENFPVSDTTFLDTLYQKGTLLVQSGCYREALKHFQQLVLLDPNSPSGWNGVGTALAGLGYLPEALQAFDQVLRLNINDSFAWNNRGCILRGLNRYSEAVESFDQALKIAPDYQCALENRQETMKEISSPSPHTTSQQEDEWQVTGIQAISPIDHL